MMMVLGWYPIRDTPERKGRNTTPEVSAGIFIPQFLMVEFRVPNREEIRLNHP